MTSSGNRLEFGMFFAPMHYWRQNPTRMLHRDLETIQYAETLGFIEAWVGEHHSGGHEVVGPTEVFLAAAVERTKRIRLGTGVVSLPYHHPFHVAERAVLLDHLSMGRTMLGVGPGSLPTDAAMMGIGWSETRRRMVESWEAVYELLTSEAPVTKKTDWFELHEAALQLAPFSQPTMEYAFTAMESPFGPSLAGTYGGSLISLSATTATGFAALARHWAVVEEMSAKHGHVANRDTWRVVAMCHVAETAEQARDEVARGLPAFANYSAFVSERTFSWMEAPDPSAVTAPPTVEDMIAAFGGTQIACIGTPDDAVAMIQNLLNVTGGFGKVLLLQGMDWASQEANNRSLELFSREVMPVFQGSFRPLGASVDRVTATRQARVAEQRESIKVAQESYSGTGFSDGASS